MCHKNLHPVTVDSTTGEHQLAVACDGLKLADFAFKFTPVQHSQNGRLRRFGSDKTTGADGHVRMRYGAMAMIFRGLAAWSVRPSSATVRHDDGGRDAIERAFQCRA